MIQTTTQDTEPRYEAFTVAFTAKPKKPTTREQKIKQLEQMLCARIEAAKPIDDITEALEILQQNRVQDEELIIRYGSLLYSNFVDIAFSLVQVGLVVTLLAPDFNCRVWAEPNPFLS